MSGTILLTGGNGKTSSRVAKQLHDAGIPFLMTSRSPPAAPKFPTIRFDWLDDTTWEAPFQHSSGQISAVYLVSPPVTDPLPPMSRFIDFARARGVRRFVLLTSRAAYCVLRPTWFMENFSEQQHRGTIRDEGKIYSATQDGKIPFVACEDIAAMAVRALTDKKSHDTEHLVLGPEPHLTCVQVAKIMSDILGRPITHVKVSKEEMQAKFIALGVPADYAPILAAMDVAISNGAEARLDDAVERVTGRLPKTFKAFAEEAKQAWL
ncbi:NAD(P)-binding protein [Schizophyllum commune H4-8]|uniref:NAD(P)-binding protein n=1 Tax=Schizophyllum commune (strain H4-8 / FGSC 9210) TaxID=578458 RepID=UPI00215F78A5|nr:NAD(P)-binding protein [Schizophyllum commune H4-8]KAI5891577.1 NAD(P)-binding protein [Schizophyllum commune H4-8]